MQFCRYTHARKLHDHIEQKIIKPHRICTSTTHGIARKLHDHIEQKIIKPHRICTSTTHGIARAYSTGLAQTLFGENPSLFGSGSSLATLGSPRPSSLGHPQGRGVGKLTLLSGWDGWGGVGRGPPRMLGAGGWWHVIDSFFSHALFLTQNGEMCYNM